jgi:hypothetical protein
MAFIPNAKAYGSAIPYSEFVNFISSFGGVCVVARRRVGRPKRGYITGRAIISFYRP